MRRRAVHQIKTVIARLFEPGGGPGSGFGVDPFGTSPFGGDEGPAPTPAVLPGRSVTIVVGRRRMVVMSPIAARAADGPGPPPGPSAGFGVDPFGTSPFGGGSTEFGRPPAQGVHVLAYDRRRL